MEITPRSSDEAMRVSNRKPWKDGWYEALIDTAIEKFSQYDNKMIELSVIVKSREGTERVVRDWVSNSERDAAKLLHICEAADLMDQYNAGKIGQADFPGKHVQVKLVTKKRNGFSGNNIEDYRAI